MNYFEEKSPPAMIVNNPITLARFDPAIKFIVLVSSLNGIDVCPYKNKTQKAIAV